MHALLIAMRGDNLTQEMLDAWPNCVTPDCQWKRCLWSSTDYCFPCAKRVVGEGEIKRRAESAGVFHKLHPSNWSN